MNNNHIYKTFMLDNKKIENWILWALIDIVSIPYFIHIGIPLVAFQYVFFLANCWLGWVEWKKTMITTQVVTA